ncbi:MAG: TIGR02221 family CRISPR-associated protein, partial [Chloroflexi bacterium]
MTLLTFLGTADYKPTTYVLGDRRHPTRYCSAAVAHFYRPKTTLVVVTQAAEARHFESLADEIAGVTTPVAVPIPDGHSEADLWQMFDALTAHVAEGDDLVVDITNGFRSLPFLSFLAVAFLRIARRVKIQRILYGAWEARNPANESPIFDLTPFLTLLDWTIATDRFTRFGDASDLAALLRQGIPAGPMLA